MIFLVLKFLLAYLLPFVIGIALAFLMQKPARALSARTRLSTGAWASVLVGTAYLLVTAAAGLLLWQLFVQISGLSAALPGYFGTAADFIGRLGNRFSHLLSRLPAGTAGTLRTVLTEAVGQLVSSLTAFFSSSAASFAKNLPAALISAIVTIVASCYLARDYEQLLRFFGGLMKPETCRKTAELKNILTGSILKYAAGYLLLMGITFAELLTGFLLLRIRYAAVLAALTAVIDILPVLGTGTVLLPWSLIEFLSGRPGAGAGLVVLYVVITVVRNFLEPRVIGHQMGISPLLTLVTMFVGFRAAGVLGMMLLPVTCIVIITYYKKQMEAEKDG